ncbi:MULTISPECIES: hypothetical protein [unclassified Enterococcus]|nr:MULTISPECIES: hypothetical protein [unclassified Enterococcus]MBS7578387.1 hypothetical protein [Enterococcus sp. MMGLQ5-2]MBS7585618.1 hypothetical protein [Enterococcus sp. MMGLQ5-1]NPD13477.1 hypothetical protein [Enterococcus sp. MMGLQ5-1]NPD38219.1 hypothetical protein [Enterococcus sp. MMGLQ5-2]
MKIVKNKEINWAYFCLGCAFLVFGLSNIKLFLVPSIVFLFAAFFYFKKK